MNVAALLARAGRYRPLHTAIVFGGKRISYGEFAERTARLAGGLQDLGLTSGDRVLFAMPNCPELLECLLGSMHAGMIAVPINQHLHPKEMAHIANDCNASAIVVASDSSDVIGLLGESRQSRHIIAVGDRNNAVPDYESLLAGNRVVPVCQVAGSEPAWLFYTSGTTGRPKGATLTHRNLLSMTMNFFADIAPVNDDAVFLHAAPLTHGSGLYALPAIAKGATNVIAASNSFEPSQYLALIEDERVTHGAFLAPTMITRIINEMKITQTDLSSLEVIVFGGGPMYVSDIELAREAFGPRLVQLYGQGEAPMTITATNIADISQDDPESQRRRASCGRCRSDVEIVIVNDESNEVPIGTIGEVCVRGEVVMMGYWNNPIATADALRNGWLHTGDLGYLDDGGYLYLVDRSKDVIITGGSNVYPREVEEALLSHEAVLEAAVVGIPDREWGESVKAFVALRPGAIVTREALIEHCLLSLARFKRPKVIEFVDELPKNSTGKILRRVLSDEAQSA